MCEGEGRRARRREGWKERRGKVGGRKGRRRESVSERVKEGGTKRVKEGEREGRTDRRRRE